MTNQSFFGGKDASVAKAKSLNLAFIRHIEKRADGPNSVLGPCLNSYKTYIEAASISSIDLLDNLSNWLIGVVSSSLRHLSAIVFGVVSDDNQVEHSETGQLIWE